MSVIAKDARLLTLSQKFSRLAKRLRDPEWRRYGGLLLGGKAIGLGMVLLIIAICSGLFFTHVYAQSAPAPEVKAADVINPINTMSSLASVFAPVRIADRFSHVYPISHASGSTRP